jgi:CRISPR-associated protein Cas1
VADLYKTETKIPVAFAAAARQAPNIESFVRQQLRERFQETRLLQRIASDLDAVLAFDASEAVEDEALDADLALPGRLWDPEVGRVAGGRDHSED